MKILLKYKAKVYEVEANEDDTIMTLKEKLEKMTIDEFKITAKEMKFIANGRILKDEQILKDANIVDKSQIFVSGTQQKSAAKEVSPGLITNNQTNENVPSNMQQNNAYNNPYNALNNSDNQLLQNMMNHQLNLIQNDPAAFERQLEPFLRGVPESEKHKWKEMYLENLKLMKDNPDMMKSAVDQIGSMDPNVLKNMMNGGAGGMQPNPFPQNFNTMPQQPYQQPNMYQQNMQFPLDSPTIPCSHGYYPYGFKFQTPISPKKEPVNLEILYKEQLQMLDDMNFKDRDLNLKALIDAKGDINKAIDYILNPPKK